MEVDSAEVTAMDISTDDAMQPAGHLASADRLGPKRLIRRIEYIRLVQQSLHSLGYPDVARALEQHSGIQMQPPEATTFQTHILAGAWDEALALLPRLTSQADIIADAQFLIFQQKYLEALEAADLATALATLRGDLSATAATATCDAAAVPHIIAGAQADSSMQGSDAPMASTSTLSPSALKMGSSQLHEDQQQGHAPSPSAAHQARLHALAALLLCPASLPPGSAARSAWLGGGSVTRGSLLAELQGVLPPALLLPPGRLEGLVEQALEAQVARCPYHNAVEGSLSLLTDYEAGPECLPTQAHQVLTGHTDEVWHVAFNRDGKRLASASKDSSVIIWAVDPASQQLHAQHTLPHGDAVVLAAWSPDDCMLLTCSGDQPRVWNTRSGKLMHSYSQHREQVHACAWMPGGTRFVCGGADKCLTMYGLGGEELGRWKKSYRVQDMAVAPGGAVLVVACSDRQIRLLRLSDQKEVALQEVQPITALALSPCGHHLLVALQSHTVHLWSLGEATRPYDPATALGPDPLSAVPSAPSLEYKLADHSSSTGRFVVRCAFGGSDANFVVHGGEDSKVYIFHRDSGDILMQLHGHTSIVNSVAWNPTNPYMLASASDDKTVRVWLAAAAHVARDGAGGGGHGHGAGGGGGLRVPLHMAPGLKLPGEQ